MAFSSLASDDRAGTPVFSGSTFGTVSGPNSVTTWKGMHGALRVLEATRQGHGVWDLQKEEHSQVQPRLQLMNHTGPALQSAWKDSPGGLRTEFP